MTPGSKVMLFNWWVWSELYVRPLCVCVRVTGEGFMTPGSKVMLLQIQV